jgi:hypothetical protein
MTDRSLPENINTDIRQNTLKDSARFLMGKRKDLAQFASAEDLVTADPFSIELDGVLHHLGTLKSALAQTLWGDQFFIGSSILDEILFDTIVDPSTTDPLSAALDKLRDTGIQGPGMILYPFIPSACLVGAS